MKDIIIIESKVGQGGGGGGRWAIELKGGMVKWGAR